MEDISLPRTICLYGDLGSGKTTFSQGFALGLGINDRFISPTYVYMKEYSLSLNTKLYHLDLYRTLPETHEFQELIHSPNNYILIEWAEKLINFLPIPRIDIQFTSLTETHHLIRIETIHR